MNLSEKKNILYQKGMDLLRRRKHSAQILFPDAKNNEFLQHLIKFCRGNETPWHKDERLHCVLTGRHEVLVMILNYLNLPLDQLYATYNKQPIMLNKGDDQND